MAHRIIKLPYEMSGKPVLRIDYKGNYTRESIKRIAQQRGQRLLQSRPELNMSVALLYPERWYGGKFKPADQEPELYSYYRYDQNDREDPERYKAFSIYITQGKPRKGGDDKYNDCLYRCLKQVLNDDLKEYFKCAYSLKRYLHLKRGDKIDISLIPKVEKKLKKYKINVRGDHIYNSTIESNLSINIKLINGHYSLDKDENNKLVFKFFNEKIPMIINYSTLEAYNPTEDKNIILTNEQIIKMRNDFQCPFILISNIEWYDKNDVKDKSLKEVYEMLIKDKELLETASKKKINIFKTGWRYKTAIELFDRLQKAVHPETITQNEAEWIIKASSGALIKSRPYEGPAYKYDVNSEYPAIMNSKGYLFPIKQGTFKIIDEIQNKNLVFDYGIYRCIIENKPDVYFRYNPSNYYTHLDLIMARKLKLNIELIRDGQANLLHYKRDDCITAYQLFGDYVELLYKMKQDKIPHSKSILNTLWGALCKSKMYYKQVNIDSEEPFIIKEDHSINTMYPVGEDGLEDVIEFYENTHIFHTNYARIKPFILAFGRYYLLNIIMPYIDKVIRVHTDSMITTEVIGIKTGSDLGMMKYEGFNPNYKLNKCNDSKEMTGEFKL